MLRALLALQTGRCRTTLGWSSHAVAAECSTTSRLNAILMVELRDRRGQDVDVDWTRD